MKEHGLSHILLTNNQEKTMLKIVNSEINLEVTPFEKITNTTETGFYHEWLKMYVEFQAKGINLTTTWECYIGELEEFYSQLIALKDSSLAKQVIFSPMEGMITMIISKNIGPEESYSFKFKIATSVRSDFFVEGIIGLDQTYIHGIIEGVHNLIHY